MNYYAYPNLTKDGRLIYISGTQLKVIDVNAVSQGAIGGPDCVTKDRLSEIYADESKL